MTTLLTASHTHPIPKGIAGRGLRGRRAPAREALLMAGRKNTACVAGLSLLANILVAESPLGISLTRLMPHMSRDALLTIGLLGGP